MKIIIGGSGSVAKSIIAYLSKGNNDIIVIDDNAEQLDVLSNEWEVMPILGSISNPDALEKAEAKSAQLIIAVTGKDEVNMIGCQIAHSLFGIKRKVACLDSRVYFEPYWSKMFDDNNIAIDLILSPEYEIAKFIDNTLKYPNVSGAYSLADKKLQLICFKLPDNCPLLQVPFDYLERMIPDKKLLITNIIRDGESILPHGEDMLKTGDEVYVLAQTHNMEDIISEFGLDNKQNEDIVIFGGTPIASYLAESLERNENVHSCKIIDENQKSSANLAQKLNHTSVFYGSMMNEGLLNEVGISHCDLGIAVTMEDKDNTVASLVAKKHGVGYTMSLVNSRSYNNKVVNVADTILIDRTSVSVSALLKELRKVKIKNAYSLGMDFGEVWEIVIDDNSSLIGSRIGDINLPKGSKIFAIYRKDKSILFASSKDVIELGDNLIFFTSMGAIKSAEKIFV